MTVHFQEVVPVDTYSVQCKGLLNEVDQNVLTLLYQPLIGAFAHSLYLTLWSEAKMKHSPKKHQHLMNVTQFSLKDILTGRKKLEAIGLLKTLKKEGEDAREYLYDLQMPLSPKAFFTDGFLSIYLFNRLGQTKFNEIRESFLIPQVDSTGFTDVTASFSDVFTSLHPSEMTSRSYAEINEKVTSENVSYLEKGVESKVNLGESDFDFEAMANQISTFVVPKEVITPKLKEAIYKLAYIYQLEPMDMSRQIQNVYYSTGDITVEDLQREIQKWYRFEHEEGLPVLALRTQPVHLKALQGMTPKSKEEELIKYFEEVSPFHLLEDYSGTTPSEVDLKLVAYCMLDQNLTPGVTNVLLDYVLSGNDMKLAKGLIERISSHWARKKVQTVPEAMALAREEKRKAKEWQEKKTSKPKYYNRDQKPNVSVPDWLKPEKNQSAEDKSSNTANEDENRKWLESLLNNSK
ncbi:replication initiation and membrane attachment family protein [Fictibacillus phosphorivorans]|uniref:replication initiation and membrane attachment family protein n=1 Tax=Fictibacillus phosphorivorans TaxID=1221500 RepID=UPI00203DAFA0|nr:DnaD domain protein [Fictibacillus phosphorivorans]MCM3717899.1 DnaD domain protein [Fictibacillus phosphorivorans]MCM3775348.1 DnaD domain protein [Fictibacillus phosphorivorans]